MRIDVVASAIAEPERFTARALIGDRTPEPEHRWRARAVIVALNRYQAIPLDVYAVVERLVRTAGVEQPEVVSKAIVDAIHACADPVGILLGLRGLPADAGLDTLLAVVRTEVLGDVYELLSARGRGHTRGSWQQAASAVHRLRVGHD